MIKTKRLFSTGLLLILTISSILTFLPSILPNSRIINEDNIPYNRISFPSLSNGIGEDPWWNASYQWRQAINITNLGNYNLTDNFISIEFDYSNLRDNYNMDPELFDVRIVENSTVRNYYIKKDFPTTDRVTIWFETNSNAGESEYDTFIYWGNSSINYRGINHVNFDPSGTSWWGFEEGLGNRGSITVDSLNYANATLWSSTSGYYPNYDSDSVVGSYSLNFDGTRDFVYINDELHYTAANEISALTVSCWFKTSFSSGGNWDNWAFIDFDRSEYFNFFITGDGRIGFSSSASGYSGQNDFYGSISGLNDGQWHFAAIVYDGVDKRIYVDDYPVDIWQDAMGGRAFGTGTSRWGFIGDGSEATAENGARNSFYYSGNLDEVRYFEYPVASDEINWLANYYPIETNLLLVTERAATVTITVKDVDGRRVPGAEVSLWKNSTDILTIQGTPYTQNTLFDGIVSFNNVPFASYNITVNYTLNSGKYENVVYNSSNTADGEVEFKGLFVDTIVYVDLWTIDFRVNDWDGIPLDYGFVQVNYSNDELENLALDSSGEATFRWLASLNSYNYSIYYDNLDYVIENPTLLNISTISRQDPKTTYYVNSTNIDGQGTPTYSVNMDTFLDGSAYASPGNITIIDASAELTKMNNLTQVRVWYLDATGHVFKELRSYTGLSTDDSFEYYPGEEEPYNVYGFRVEVEGANSSICNGVIDISLSYEYNQYIQVNMSKLEIIVLDNTETVLVEGIKVRLTLNGTNNVITELKTNENGSAKGLINKELTFWYKTNVIYNITLWIASVRYPFKINSSDQYFNPSPLAPTQQNYNYTLKATSTMILEIALNLQDYITKFQNGSLKANTLVKWGDKMSFSINYTTSNNGVPGPWTGDDGTGSTVICSIKSTIFGNPVLYQKPMNFLGNGNYSLEVNSSQFSAGNTGNSYIVVISGEKSTYKKAEQTTFVIVISTLSTGITFHNYTTLSEFSTNEASQYYNDLINVSVKYFDLNSNIPLIAELFTFSWDYGSGSLNPDPFNPGYYTIEIDTSDATNTGKYRIEVTAIRENYTKIEDFGFDLNILSRPTSLNDSDGVIYVSENIFIFEKLNFTFEYKDGITTNLISNADEKSYLLQKLDDDGNPLAGSTEIGSLIEDGNNRYVLNINTEFRTVGEYSIVVTFNTLNYEHRIAIISLKINKRVFIVQLPGKFHNSTKIEINSGAALKFTLTLMDPYNNSVAVLGANVYLIIKNNNITFSDNNDGTYTVNIPKIKDAFFLPETFTAIFTVNKQYFSSESITITIVVKMHATFGFPTFYLLMIIGAIVAVTASLLIYRVVQLAKIPTFVKKARKMKKEIKSKKNISESLLYPSKEEYLTKQLESKWEILGLSLEKILGTDRDKKKKLSETTGEFKNLKGGEI